MSESKPHSTPENESPGFFDKPKNVTWILRVFYAICVILVALDFIVHRHIYTEFEEIPAFYAIYGFVACVVLVIIAKEMRRFLMRDEDYYDPTQEREATNKEGDE